MKRNANRAFEDDGSHGAPPGKVFKPTSDALMDPMAYFTQWQQAAHSAAVSMTQRPAVPSPAEKSDVHKQVEECSAVKCASIVKEKAQNFTTAVALAAMTTMATKSSFKLREELFRQPHVRKLCQRMQETLRRPPDGVTLEQMAEMAWCLTRFPPEALGGDARSCLAAVAYALGSGARWSVDVASKVIWSLAKADVVGYHKQLVSKIVAELVANQGRRVNELTDEALMNVLWSVTRARRVPPKKPGQPAAVHKEANDEELFKLASKRVIANCDAIDVKLLADLVHTHAEVGIRDEPLFKAMGVRICAKQKELREDIMGRVIKAYTRFMIPLREEQQGFRTLAIVQKGDFIRPSDKPKKTGPRTYDHPVALFEKTQVHARA